MNPLTLSKTQSEPLIGTAVSADTFILLETPQPWSKPALLSEGVPESLRQMIKSLLGPSSGVRVHLIANEETPTQTRRRILVFRHAALPLTGNRSWGLGGRLAGEYKAWEIQTETPAEMAPALSEFLHAMGRDKWVGQHQLRSVQRHLMICTHASHNECCGMYGYPFYQAAIAQVNRLGLGHQVLPWQISHIGGHRFAPTLIDFPQGRYYGNLDEASLLCLLKQQGAIAPLLPTYRGWSLLPKPLQLLEGELLKQYKWDWLRGRVAGRILHEDEESKQFWVELWFESAKRQLLRYTAEIRDNLVVSYQREPDFESDLDQLIHRKTG